MSDEKMTEKGINAGKRSGEKKLPWLWDILLIGILLIGAYLRFTGLKWDETYHLHPDERFLTMVETSIVPVEKLSDYFNTSTSSLNPNNHGYTFYVYGTLPLFIVRYVGEWLGQTGYDQINVVGRVLSGVFDLGTIVFVYLIGKRLYKNSRMSLLAALFSALAVLQIQLSHYLTVDNFANFFTYASIYTAVWIITGQKANSTSVDIVTPTADTSKIADETSTTKIPMDWLTSKWSSLVPYGLFGIFYGMALASKVSIWALALLLPISAFVLYKTLPDNQKAGSLPVIFRNLVLAGVIAFLTFRIFQPYAFMGPGFFGIRLNPNWLANMTELNNLSTGDIDVPYALQWARRPITFTLQNFILWGAGIPLGLLSLAGFLWMFWRMVKGDWKKHLVIWVWVAFILVTQSLNWVRSMRYILPVYPALALIAAWVIFKLYQSGKERPHIIREKKLVWRKPASIVIAILTVVGTAIWAFAFLSIYTRPVTRVAASEWIYENIPGAINLRLTKNSGEQISLPVAYQDSALISSDTPYKYVFRAQITGDLEYVSIEHVLSQQVDPVTASLVVTIREVNEGSGEYLTAGFIQSSFAPVSTDKGDIALIKLEKPVQVTAGNTYELNIEVAEPGVFLRISGSVSLRLVDEGRSTTFYLPQPVYRLSEQSPFQTTFFPREAGSLSEITLNRVVDLTGGEGQKTLRIVLVDPTDPGNIIASGSITDEFLAVSDPRGDSKKIVFDKPVDVDPSSGFIIQLSLTGDGELGIYNNGLVIESTWDDPLPLNMYGYNQFGYWDGIYGNIRNQEIYWDDTESKREMFKLTLDQSDTIIITSNRQWGTIPRVPERYPLSTEYYRALIGCPSSEDILYCYSVAQPGKYSGELGYELTKVFQSDPTLGKVRINDQFAEEAFTVYDHPKVLIFQKIENYDQDAVHGILDSVDITRAVHKTPRQASKFTGNLMLSTSEWTRQVKGGTWSELFPLDSLLNKVPWLSAVAWYVTLTLLGLLVYPIVRFVLKGLNDHGYPLSRLSGLLLLAYFTWLAGSSGIALSRLTIGLVMLVLAVISGVAFHFQKNEIIAEVRSKKKYFLVVEGVMLGFFLLDLLIRIGNPDLWHPWKGGEKPMDLSYFTAVLKSTTFPPYDPWYSGGYINYYYYGFVIVGVLVKFLGILPEIAYNLIIPTLFSLTGLGAFSLGWNLLTRQEKHHLSSDSVPVSIGDKPAFLAGITASFAVLIFGNLGTVRMFWQGLVKMGTSDGLIEGLAFFEKIKAVFSGLGRFLIGANLPYGFGDWYWNPSRAIPGDVITEFPFFTFTYADLHAHMIALPITLLVLGWSFSMLFRKWVDSELSEKRQWVELVCTLLFGAFVIGTLRPTNTWDLPTYLAFAVISLFYCSYRGAEPPGWFFNRFPNWTRRFLYAGALVTFLIGFVVLFYLPFAAKYGQAYGSIDTWKGDHTYLKDFLVHWGWQLFLITTWFVWETREWLASTPVSVIKRFKPYIGYIQVVAILFLLVLILLTLVGIRIGWMVSILAVWALILILKPDQPVEKRVILFMIGTGMVLTLFVELFALEGDIGRMNTVFKFYFQAWTLLGISSAASLVWLFPTIVSRWKNLVSNTWQVVFVLLAFSAILYPVTASLDKIRDRISSNAPQGLNGITYMKTSTYNDQGIDLDLNQDYEAIKWMRENVIGSPVIVETNTVEYRWGNRYTIYTGLPGVLGWNWHQRQQRGFLDYNGINNRLNEIPAFYQTTDVNSAIEFLSKYNVKYIMLGQMEQLYYPGDGLLKFEAYEGQFWNEVFRFKDTVIYEVISQ